MQTFNTLFETELRKAIERRIDDLRLNLEVNSYSEIGQFKYVMGQINALRSVDELIEEARKASDQSNR
jgi:hypothetical protein